MVHNSKALIKSLIAFIMDNVTGHRSGFEVSSKPHRDGTVSVRFRSSPVDSAVEASSRFREAWVGTGRLYTHIDEVMVRVSLDEIVRS